MVSKPSLPTFQTKIGKTVNMAKPRPNTQLSNKPSTKMHMPLYDSNGHKRDSSEKAKQKVSSNLQHLEPEPVKEIFHSSQESDNEYQNNRIVVEEHTIEDIIKDSSNPTSPA